MKKKLSTRDICLCAVFAALAAIGAFIKIPFPLCPKTLQMTFVILSGLLLGRKLGALSIAVYVIIGLVGVPVFTAGGGPAYVLQPTFGYLAAFILSAFVTGAIVDKYEKPSFARILIAAFAGLLISYAIGTSYLFMILKFVTHTPITLKAALTTYFVFLLPWDIVLAVIASFLAHRLLPTLNKGRITNDTSIKAETI